MTVPAEPVVADREPAAEPLSSAAALAITALGAGGLVLGQSLAGSGWPLATAPAAICALAIAGTRAQRKVAWLVFSAALLVPHLTAGWPPRLWAVAVPVALLDIGLMFHAAGALVIEGTALTMALGVATARVVAEVVWDRTAFGDVFCWGQHVLDWSMLSQAAALTGLKGLSFLLVYTSSAFAVLCVDPGRPVARRTAGLALALAALAVGHGASRLDQSSGEALRVAAVGSASGGRRELLTATATAGSEQADVVVWPEAAVPLPELMADEVRRQVGIVAAEHDLYLTIGCRDSDGRNVALTIGPDGAVDHDLVYNQVHGPLHPEEALGGEPAAVVQAPFGGLAVLLGDDLLDGELARIACHRRATVLAVPADSERSLTRDQLLLARARAIENSCIVVLAAQHGTAAVCDPFGHVVAQNSTALQPDYQVAVAVPLVRELQPGLMSRGVLPWVALGVLGWLLVVRPRPAAYDTGPFEPLFRYDG